MSPRKRCRSSRARSRCTAKRLDAYVADRAEWGPVRRVAISDQAPNGCDGMRATEEVGAFRRQYNQCVEVTPPGILDKKFAPPTECSAQALENICVGK